MKKVLKNKKIKVSLGSLDTKIDILANTVDFLAISVAKGFDRVETELKAELKSEINGVKTELKNDINEVKENLKATRADVLTIGDRFVPRFEFDNLLMRVGKLEKELKSKAK